MNRLQLPNQVAEDMAFRVPCSWAQGLQSPCAAGHRAWLRQVWHRGRTGRQICWPKPTNSPLISLHRSLWGGSGLMQRERGKEGRWEGSPSCPVAAPGQPVLQGCTGLLRGLGHLLGPPESVGNSVHVCVHCCLETGWGECGAGPDTLFLPMVPSISPGW